MSVGFEVTSYFTTEDESISTEPINDWLCIYVWVCMYISLCRNTYSKLNLNSLSELLTYKK